MAAKKTKLRRIAAILGTLTIIVTFVVRDIVRERAKDELTKVENAQQVFLARSDNSFIMIRVVDLTHDVWGLIHSHDQEREMNHLPPFVDPVLAAPSLLEVEDNYVLADGLVIENIEALLRAVVPNSIPEEKEYPKLKERYLALAERVRKQKASTPSEPTYASAAQLQDVKSFNGEALDLREKSLNFARRAFSETVTIQDSLVDSYRFTNDVFYIIFAIGVLVNLWGSLTGLDAERGIE